MLQLQAKGLSRIVRPKYCAVPLKIDRYIIKLKLVWEPSRTTVKNLTELTLWSNGVALSMSDTPVVMNSDYDSKAAAINFVDGNANTIIYTDAAPCDPDPWVYIDVGTRFFDQVFVKNRPANHCCRDRINGARISFIGDVNGEVPI